MFLENPPGSTNIPPCEWNGEEQVVIHDLQLKVPSYGISNYFLYRIPTDRIIRSLHTVMQINGDYSIPDPSQAELSINMKVGGADCMGEKEFKFKKDDNEILSNGAIIPFPSFSFTTGEVRISLNTDTFIDYTGSSSAYQVVWTASGNNPNGGIDGFIVGTKISFSSNTKKAILPPDDYIIIDGKHQFKVAP